ncbi:MAG: zinc-dependent metalloprotease, partial [Actinomycetota bacterium]
GQAALASILGISFDRALENKGETFCAAVVKLKGLGTLNHVWDAPDNLPSPDEIKDPFQWMERVLEE